MVAATWFVAAAIATGAVATPPAACAGDGDTCRAEAEDSAALLQHGILAVGEKGQCAWSGQDPYANGRDHTCCHGGAKPLQKVLRKWQGPYTKCTYLCKECSSEGEDVYRYCGTGCGDKCKLNCCPGYEEHKENSKVICRQSTGWTARGCASAGEDPYARGKNHKCCDEYLHGRHAVPLQKVLRKWSGSKCTYRCEKCSRRGEDIFRFCPSGCHGCQNQQGPTVIHCCPGLSARKVRGKYICQ